MHSPTSNIHTSPGSATWVHNREQAPPTLPDPGPTATGERRAPAVAKRIELARYTLSDGTERVLYGQRIDGSVRVTDRPAAAVGRAYLVERDLHTKGELDALLADYLKQAAQHDRPPVAVCPLESLAETIA